MEGYRELSVAARQCPKNFELTLEQPVERCIVNRLLACVSRLGRRLTVIAVGYKALKVRICECIHMYELEWYRVRTCVSKLL